jgi:hypothetical protein
MKKAFLRDVSPCGTCKNIRFGILYRPHHQGEKNQRDRNNVSSNSVCNFPFSTPPYILQQNKPV